MNEEVVETAKATQEVAKTATKALDTSEKLGGFIAKYIGGTLEQGMGIFEDKLKYIRWERQLELKRKVEEELKNRGLTTSIKTIPLKLAIPFFEAATLEDSDYLQQLWANLLINASDKASNFELQRIFIDILERLSPLEAKILEYMNASKGIFYNVQTSVDGVHLYETYQNLELKEQSSETKLALANLYRLGCISPKKTLDENEQLTQIKLTYLGEVFVKACTR